MGGRGRPKSRTGKHSRGPYTAAGGGGGKGGPRLGKGALGSTGIRGGLTGGKGGGANPEPMASLSGASG